jgi:hypothetical protein
VGIRFKLGPGPSRVEVYLLPLLNNSAYNELRRFVGGGTVRYSPSRIPPGTVFRLLTRLEWPDFAKEVGAGNWALVHLDGRGLNLMPFVRQATGKGPADPGDRERAADLPLLLGLGVADATTFTAKLREWWEADLKPQDKDLVERNYRGVTIKEAPLKSVFPDGPEMLFHALVAGGAYLTWDKALLERTVDEVLDRGKAKPKDEVEANASLYLAPPGGKNAEAISALLAWLHIARLPEPRVCSFPREIGMVLVSGPLIGSPEKAIIALSLRFSRGFAPRRVRKSRKVQAWETHRRALSAVTAWQTLHEAGAVTARMSYAEKTVVARRLLGYAPASPDGTAFVFDEKLRQVRNERHGSPSRPVFHDRLAPGAGILQLLSQLRSLRVDLRFREDGIHTVLTLSWAPAGR